MNTQSCVQLFNAFKNILFAVQLLSHTSVFQACCFLYMLQLKRQDDSYPAVLRRGSSEHDLTSMPFRHNHRTLLPKKPHLARSGGQILSLLHPILVTHLEHPALALCLFGLGSQAKNTVRESKKHISLNRNRQILSASWENSPLYEKNRKKSNNNLNPG